MLKFVNRDWVQTWIPPLAAVALTVALFHAYFTSHLVGGTDAVWYAFVAHDVVTQFRDGTFPILVGNSEFNWVGSVHPFRSAPMHLYLIQVVDLVTGLRLPPLLVQHLAIIATAALGTLSFHRLALALTGGRPWIAAFVAWLYGSAAIWCTLAAYVDGYMSFTMTAMLPWVMLGLHHVARTEGQVGFPTLAAAVVVAWMTHPPIALAVSLVALFSLVVVAGTWRAFPWAKVAIGGATAVGLGAFYFVAMSELPRKSGDPKELLTVGLMAVALVSTVRGLRNHGLGWWVAAAGAAAVLFSIHLAWFIWLLAFTGIAAVLVRSSKTLGLEGRPHRLTVISMVLATFAAGLAMNPYPLGTFGGTFKHPPPELPGAWADWVMPYSLEHLSRMNQPGPALVLPLLLLPLIAWERDRSVRMFCVFLGLTVVLLTRVPVVSTFLTAHLPSKLADIMGYPLAIRLHPILTVGFGALAALALAQGLADTSRPKRATAWALLGIGVCLNVLHFTRFTPLFQRQVYDESFTRQRLLQEGRDRKTFDYDLVTLPKHFYSGVTHPSLELRFLDPKGAILIGPDDLARLGEAEGFTPLSLNYSPYPVITTPLRRVDSKITLPPHSLAYLRFEDPADADKEGVWIWLSDHFYREYTLSRSIQNRHALANPPEKGTVVPAWNSTDHARTIEWQYLPRHADAVPAEGRFANLHLSEPPKKAPITLRTPWKADFEVEAPAGGILETFRIYLPGYRAVVDGRTLHTVPTANGLVGVPLAAGKHTVKVYYRTPMKIRIAGWITALTALGMGTLAIVKHSRFGRAQEA